eukprot:snap_masked-scaffold_18-processed-gene-6.57-mRNA-1 protein AED:1.00 eAED:1.00 QI:0/-1/0/0/-1/1/1/0/95
MKNDPLQILPFHQILHGFPKQSGIINLDYVSRKNEESLNHLSAEKIRNQMSKLGSFSAAIRGRFTVEGEAKELEVRKEKSKETRNKEQRKNTRVA